MMHHNMDLNNLIKIIVMIKRTVSQDFRTSVKKLFFCAQFEQAKAVAQIFRFHDEIYTKTLTTRTQSQRSR